VDRVRNEHGALRRTTHPGSTDQVTEAERIQRLLDQYKAGRITRDEFWTYVLMTRAECTKETLSFRPR
jgi:hypothetical protein